MTADRDPFASFIWGVCFGAFVPPALPEAWQAQAPADRAPDGREVKTPAPAETGDSPEGT